MTMYYDSKITLIRFIASMVLIFVMGFAACEWYHSVFGQDIDPRYVCFYKDQYPFNKMCQDQRIHDMVKGAVELANKKDAEFCHVFANLSYCQDKCDIDESLCVLGRPDPDFNDTAYTIHAPVGWACFDNHELEQRFLKIPGNEGFNTTVPCSNNTIINPSEDESGK